MKILIYTSLNPGFINEFNTSVVCSHFSKADILILKVNKPKFNLLNSLRGFVYQVLNGKDKFKKQNKLIKKSFITKNSTKLKTVVVSKVNNNQSISIINNFNPDIIIQAGAGILTKDIFSLSKLGTLNIHHGFCPEIRGVNSTFWCLCYGLTNLIGVTCHLIDDGIDTGPVIKQYNYKYNLGDSYFKIQSDLISKGANLLVDSIEILVKNKGELAFKKVEVKSWYFSSMNYLDFNLLEKNGFKKIKDIKTKNYKIKVKMVLSN